MEGGKLVGSPPPSCREAASTGWALTERVTAAWAATRPGATGCLATCTAKAYVPACAV